MTAVANYMETPRSHVAMVHGKRRSLSTKALFWVFGCAFILAGFGLWLMPGLDGEPVVLLSKLGVSIALLVVGVVMTQTATGQPRKELHFDPSNRQLLVFEGLPGRRKRVIQAMRYDDIMRVDVSDRVLEVFDLNGRVSVVLPLAGAEARVETLTQLRSQAILPV